MACAYRGSSGTREIRHVLPEEAGNIEYTGISKYQASQCSVERCEESERKTRKIHHREQVSGDDSESEGA
ncbi:MAG: hypothetical protein GY820_21690 [Gammaproteobacteria bacterium]|nr:hypothetical protein [Gammaproteobacteria bacterium]